MGGDARHRTNDSCIERNNSHDGNTSIRIFVCLCVCVSVCVWSMLSGPRSDYKLQWQYALHSMRIDCICIMYIFI